MTETRTLEFLKDLWNDREADALAGNPLGLLRYRSNLLGADLRITNFGGGNTSSKIEFPDPFTGQPTRVLAVKGSGGDLGSIKDSGFALVYFDRLEQLKRIYRAQFEDEMVGFYPLSAFGQNRVAASIDTPLHAFLPFPHVDHLHPDWAIALAASANGKQKLAEFNKQFGRQIVWVPWQRPGFELALMIEDAVKDTPDADGILLGSHGLFTWGRTQRECYLKSLHTIDQMGQYILEHQRRSKSLFGGVAYPGLPTRRDIATESCRRCAGCSRPTAGWWLISMIRKTRLRLQAQNGRANLPPGHELPGSFSPYASLPALSAIRPRQTRCCGLEIQHRGARR